MSFDGDTIINTESLILEVEARPCLWDATCESYRNQDVKVKAWLEIAQQIITDFEYLDEDEQLKAAEKVKKRWRYTRSCHTRAVRSMLVSNDKQTKSYIYSNLLIFLNKNNDRNKMNVPRTVSTPDAPNHSSSGVSEPSIIDDSDSERDEEEPKEKKRKSTTYEELKHQLLLMINNSSKNANDEDTAFFNSLLPAVRELNTFEKLVFRNKVIEELITITRKK